jgi:hypothetical protein
MGRDALMSFQQMLMQGHTAVGTLYLIELD